MSEKRPQTDGILARGALAVGASVIEAVPEAPVLEGLFLEPSVPAARDDLTAPVGAVGDSVTVAGWTALSRASGFIRVAVVAAVLGPTFFGNTYQFTNSLPNLIYYGFLAGSLFSSLLVPALVRHIDTGDAKSAARVAGGIFGVTSVAMVVLIPLAVLVTPELLHTVETADGTRVGANEIQAGRLLVALLMPQVLFYGIIGPATAVQNAHRRFAVAAGAPVLENLGTIAVLLLVDAIYRPSAQISQVPLSELVLLGAGSTAAVGAHAALQWWGARRVGITLRPLAGWRDAEVTAVVRRAVPSLAQTGLAAVQLIVLLVFADRVAGGVVGFQIALNFYFLPVAMAATPVALSLVPRLSRIDPASPEFHDTLVRGLGFAGFLAVPAATGYLVLAGPMGRAIALGRMNSAGAADLVSASLRSLAPGLLGEAAFLILTYAAYSRGDMRRPLKAMCVQVVVCVSVATTSLLVHGPDALAVLGAALSAGTVAGSAVLYAIAFRHEPHEEQLSPRLARAAIAAAVMAGPAWLTAIAVGHHVTGRLGEELAVVAAVLVGTAVFFTWQGLLRAQELRWLADSLGFPHRLPIGKRRARQQLRNR